MGGLVAASPWGIKTTQGDDLWQLMKKHTHTIIKHRCRLFYTTSPLSAIKSSGLQRFEDLSARFN